MFKKMTVLAMALGVVVAMALPATAAGTWKHHNTAIQEDVTFGLTGTAGTQTEAGGFYCQITAQAKFFAGQTRGQLETWVAHPTGATTNCAATGGLSQCEVETVQPTNLPWTFHTTGSAENPTIELTVGDMHTELRKKNLFCTFNHYTRTEGTVLLTPTPSNGKTVTSLSLSGQSLGHLYTQTSPGGSQTTPVVSFQGELSMESPNISTYSL
jgi:hypothetical protein